MRFSQMNFPPKSQPRARQQALCYGQVLLYTAT